MNVCLHEIGEYETVADASRAEAVMRKGLILERNVPSSFGKRRSQLSAIACYFTQISEKEVRKMERPGDNILYILDVCKIYGAKAVLDDIDLSVSSGELCTLVGPSGCGKSTLLRLILGQERPTRGEIRIEGKPVGFPNPERGIVYQKYSLFPHLTVLENVMLGKKLSVGLLERRYRLDEFREEAKYYLGKIKLAGHLDKYPHELSGGMQQRVALAQSLIMKPKLLLMDEPFGALDPGTREDMQIFLLNLWEEFKMTIFFVTHRSYRPGREDRL
jgi:NitT/TauT family transport system ATP-binding protein